MKSEFSTAKDLDKLRTELTGKAGGALDPNHPDMGPIMESLIMTSSLTIMKLGRRLNNLC